MKSKISALVLACVVSLQAGAETTKLDIAAEQINLTKQTVAGTKLVSDQFTEIKFDGFENSRGTGVPSVPVKSWLLVGQPSNIHVNVIVTQSITLENTRPMPVQEEPCRCSTSKASEFKYNLSAYAGAGAGQNYELKYLGSFRGTPVTQLNVKLAHYDQQTNETVLDTGVQVTFDVPEFAFEQENLKNYLIITPSALSTGLDDFVQWKISQGYNVIVEQLYSPGTTLDAVSNIIKKYYASKQADFVMIIGDEKTVPMYMVQTASSSQTPSDLNYFLMDGAGDTLPDVYSSRIVANSADQVKSILSKSIEFEKRSYLQQSGLKSMIGIASNEGSSPSDNDYIQHIEKQFQNKFSIQPLHLYQDDPNSNPTTLNKALESGAIWLTYIGHGSGTSWPSMYTSYSTNDMSKIKNKNSVKPIIIDVACQNGRLVTNQFGATFSKVFGLTTNDSFGAAAYLGGSVNISWHPPAIMAVGIAEEHGRHNYKHLAQAVMAGQFYLAGRWASVSEVADNWKWYHLQGDPGMNIHF